MTKQNKNQTNIQNREQDTNRQPKKEKREHKRQFISGFVRNMTNSRIKDSKKQHGRIKTEKIKYKSNSTSALIH